MDDRSVRRTATPTLGPSDPDARAILFLYCAEHVIGCEQCRHTFRLRWVPRTESGVYACPLCGFDLAPAVVRHTDTCVYWTGRNGRRKPPAIIESFEPPATATA